MQVVEADVNHDGKPDSIRIRVGAVNTQQVVMVNLVLEFSYKLKV
jgi:hypothetical protein